MIIGIIGAGASGMAAAIEASSCQGAQVILLERQARVGRKLQATGNGRCNLTNLNNSPYHGQNAEFAIPALSRYDVQNTLEWFRMLGLYTVSEPTGRVYPYSDQANSVVDVLRFGLDRPNIRLVTGFEVSKITRNESGFTIESGEECIFCHKLIVACGGLAGTKLGGSMSGYKLLRSIGHSVTKLRPALVQLKCEWPGITALKGVRANCRAVILHAGVPFAASIGEIQFTEYGLSGPVVFEISRDVCQGAGDWVCKLDFLPDMNCDELEKMLSERKDSALTADDLLTGILHNRLGRVIVQNVGIRGNMPISQMPAELIQEICRCVKGFEITLKEPLGMESAQVTAGGIVTEQFDPQTMESRIVPGLYACGEVLDIDGDCGGYNLQWAWSSGRLAGFSAGGDKL